jgi:hypothetical protein
LLDRVGEIRKGRMSGEQGGYLTTEINNKSCDTLLLWRFDGGCVRDRLIDDVLRDSPFLFWCDLERVEKKDFVIGRFLFLSFLSLLISCTKWRSEEGT